MTIIDVSVVVNLGFVRETRGTALKYLIAVEPAPEAHTPMQERDAGRDVDRAA